MEKTNVIADAIDLKTIYVTCPFCFTRYNKKGLPTKKAKRSLHFHGSGGDLTNRTTHRLSHCKKAIYYTLVIDDKTKRI